MARTRSSVVSTKWQTIFFFCVCISCPSVADDFVSWFFFFFFFLSRRRSFGVFPRLVQTTHRRRAAAIADDVDFPDVGRANVLLYISTKLRERCGVYLRAVILVASVTSCRETRKRRGRKQKFVHFRTCEMPTTSSNELP